MKKIVLDIMSGDFGWREGVEAVRKSIGKYNCRLILTCTRDIKEILNKEISDLIDSNLIELYESAHIVTHGEEPHKAFEEKNRNTITDAIRLVKEGRGNAVVSPGNTGLYVYSAKMLQLPCLEELTKFPLVAQIPALNTFPYGGDVGAHLIANNRDLEGYAILLDAFLRAKGIENPKIGLLNIGEEKEKGTGAYRRANANLEKMQINFIGNVEPIQVKSGLVDGFVCMGNDGNRFLKTIEAYVPLILDLTPKIFKPLFYLTPQLLKMADKSNYDAAVLLGYDNPIIKVHGNSNAKALYNAIRTAIEYLEIIKEVKNKAIENLGEYKKCQD